MNIWGRILKWMGWKVSITAPFHNKCVICVAPHTSNWDFIMGLLAYRSLGRKTNFLMKEFWFFFPLKYLLKSLGGIPVPSKRKGKSVTQTVVEQFEKDTYINLAVTPEGTRSRTDHWHTGCLYIAYETKVPIQLGYIDFKNKEVVIHDEFTPSGNIEEDMQFVKNFYSDKANCAKYPDKFTT